MRNRTAIFLILLSCLVTGLTWSTVQPVRVQSIYQQVSHLLAALGIVVFAWIFFIATRNRWVDRLFCGMDKAYVTHKYLSIAALALVWIHKLTIDLGKIRVVRTVQTEAPRLFGIKISSIGEGAAEYSLLLFSGLAVLAIVAVKLDYQKWKLLHKLMLVPFFLGVIHYYISSRYLVFAFNPFSLWMNFIILVGVLSAVYSVFLYERTAFRYRYRVAQLREVAAGALEITATAIGEELRYKPGQFAFLKIAGKEGIFPSHPFTISSAPRPGQIQFTVKALGDHTTALQKAIQPGDVIALSGPHGGFDYQAGAKRQVWVAGGIGITPFRSFLQAPVPPDYQVDLFYAYANAADGAYAEELKTMELPENLRIHLINSEEAGFLKVEDITRCVGDFPFDLYFCGPSPMRKYLQKGLAQTQCPLRVLHFEKFQFKGAGVFSVLDRFFPRRAKA